MKLTVVIPTYNSQETIIRAIDSCLSCIKSIEIVVVDDASQDQTIQTVKDNYNQLIKSGHIKVIIANHAGAGNARNIGIMNASSEWVTFLDSDDEFLDLVRVVDDLNKKNIASFNIINYLFDYGKTSDDKMYAISARSLTKDNLGISSRNSCVWDSGPCSKVFKKSFLLKNNIKFPVNIKIGEDQVFNQKCLQTNIKILIINHPIYKIIENKNSITHVIIKQKVVDDTIKLVMEVQKLKLSSSLIQAFVAKNFILLLVRFLKSNKKTKEIIVSLKKYKSTFPLQNDLIIFYNLRLCLGSIVSLVGYLIWLNPEFLIILRPLMTKVRY